MATTEQLAMTDPEWRRYVDAHPDAHPFHLPEWAALVADCYGLDAFVVVVRDERGGISAGLPLAITRPPFRRARLVALPFTDFCPPLAEDDRAQERLASALDRARASVGADRVVVRGPMPAAVPSVHAGFRHVLSLSPDVASVYARFHRSQVHRSIRRAEASGLTVRVGRPGADLLDDFYALHLATRRRLGVPVQPRRFFALLRERILEPRLGWVVSVESAGRPIAAGVFLAAGGTVVYKFGASAAEAWSLRPNHLMFWHVIRAACQDGRDRLDFGRSDADAEGLRAFKRSWGAVEEPLLYHAMGRSGAAPVPAAGSSLLRTVMSATIRRGPLWVCRLSGEVLYRFVA